jgi:plastocyanin
MRTLIIAIVVTASIIISISIYSSLTHDSNKSDISKSVNKIDINNPNIHIYAVSDRAKTALDLAMQDDYIKDRIRGWLNEGAYITVAGVQPVELSSSIKISEPKQQPVHHEAVKIVLEPLIDNLRPEADESLYNSSRYGEVVVTANWRLVDGYDSIDAIDISSDGIMYEAHQQLLRIIVDIDESRIKDMITEERVIRHKIRSDLIYMETNVFIPDAVIVRPTKLSWHNYSSMPHNVVGVYKPLNGSPITINSGNIASGDSWYYIFDGEGVFEYYCTYHEDEGMRGKVIIRR